MSELVDLLTPLAILTLLGIVLGVSVGVCLMLITGGDRRR